MKRLAMLLLLLSGGLSAGEVIEIDVNGMTCGFCVDAVRRKLDRLPDIEQAQVSLRSKKVRIEARPGGLDIERVRKTILDAGFTPLAVRHVGQE